MKMGKKKKPLNNFETKCDDEVNIIGVSKSKGLQKMTAAKEELIVSTLTN